MLKHSSKTLYYSVNMRRLKCTEGSLILVSFCLLLAVTIEACSPADYKRVGAFVQDARPIRDRPNEVLAKVDLFTLEQEDDWEPSATLDIIVDMETGDVIEKPDMLEIVTANNPIPLTEPTGGYVLTIDSDSTPPTATLSSLSSSSSSSTSSSSVEDKVTFRLDIRPDGTTIRDIDDWQRRYLQENTLFFYSPSFDMVYVLYQLIADDQLFESGDSVMVTTFHTNSNSNNWTQGSTFYAHGLPYVYSSSSSPLVCDDVHVAELDGQGADCVYGQYIYYNETSVTLIAQSVEGNSMDLIDAIDADKSTFYLVHQNEDYDCSDPCPEDGSSCCTATTNETVIEEYLINATNTQRYGSTDQNTALRRVTITTDQLVELFNEAETETDNGSIASTVTSGTGVKQGTSCSNYLLTMMLSLVVLGVFFIIG